jgi:DNA-binding transcriptional ArsR family regulator
LTLWLRPDMLNRMVEYRDDRLDATYAAISHPVRRAVLQQLRGGQARVTDLAVPFAMSLAAVSKHIGVLEDAGLLERAVRGREHLIALNPSPLLPAARWLDSYQAFWEERLDLLEAKLRGRNAR